MCGSDSLDGGALSRWASTIRRDDGNAICGMLSWNCALGGSTLTSALCSNGSIALKGSSTLSSSGALKGRALTTPPRLGDGRA